MKKVFFALLCTAAVALAGCKSANNPLPGGTKGSDLTEAQIAAMDNTVEKCWHIAQSVTVAGHSETNEWYEWGTEKEIATGVKAVADAPLLVGSVVIAYKESDAKTIEECRKLDEAARQEEQGKAGEDLEDYACYEVSVTIEGQKMVQGYMWTDEEGIKLYVDTLNKNTQLGYTYKKMDNITDQEACIGNQY